MNISSELNLARKWRPLTFESIIGQELTVRLLKNSLFKQHFLPVYLLSGQRGCGKTTTARVFAAAINCLQLDEFSRNPHHIVPCGSCASCLAMRHGNHPDFIEIDAASHTGVDNVRQIIEATTFLPHMGRKKIYLIDEAHMLSKAAFNAFLKILEEPPKTVLFMMATTDSHKIIDTVRSRCFQLFFEPLAQDVLLEHLVTICEKEALAYEREALAVIVKEAEGSVRDALNLIERVRLAHETINTEATRSVFGSLDDQAVINLLAALARKEPAALVAVWQEHQLATKPASLIWKKLFDYLHTCLLLTFSHQGSSMSMYEEQLREIAADMPAPYIVRCMEAMYSLEQQFLKTTVPHAVLEVLLIKLCMASEISESPAKKPEKMIHTPAPTAPVKSAPSAQQVVSKTVERPLELSKSSGPAQWWQQFVAHITTVGDPLLTSVMQQGRYTESDATGAHWKVCLPKELSFFQDIIEKHAPAWKALLVKICQKDVTIDFQFTLASAAPEAPKARVASPAPVHSTAKKPVQRNTGEKVVDVSDAQKWEKTHTLLEIFPGTVSEVKGSTHE